MYKQQAFNGEEALPPRGRYACTAMQCLPVGEFSDTGITNLQCASGNFNKCGTLNIPTLEGETDKMILGYAFKVLPTCTHCGPIQMGAKYCNFCLKKFKSKHKKQGKISRRKHLVLEQQRIDFFWKLYQAALPKYVFHRWKYLVLGGNLTTDVRQASLKKGEVSKCLTIKIESTLVGHLCDI